MIRELTKLEDLEKQLDLWIEVTRAAEAELNEPQPRPALERNGVDKEAVQQMSNLLAKAKDELNEAKQEVAENEAKDGEPDKSVYIASHPNLSMVQSIMHSGYMVGGQVETTAAQGASGSASAGAEMSLSQDALTPPQKLFGGIFDEPGPGYAVGWLAGVTYSVFQKTQPFRKPGPMVKLGNKARIVVAGDWGTGHARAQAIGKMMQQCLEEAAPDQDRHVVHLGDIYFSGLPSECSSRFLSYWPSQPAPDVKHWSTNGNHDMYCGGKGYFQVVLGDQRFSAQRFSSNFSFGNDHWQFIGLDTAYDEWRLSSVKTGNQAVWAAGLIKDAPNAKRVLLSHHQPWSDYEGNKPAKAGAVAVDAAPLMADGKTAAWLWGHEHRCAIYNPLQPAGWVHALPFGSCIGHSGVPCKPTKEQGPNARHVLLDSTAGVIPGNVGETYGLMGFAVIDIDGDQAEIRYYHELDPQMTSPHFTASL
jgi:hypothetical protein